MAVLALVPIHSFRRLESALRSRADLQFCAGATDVLAFLTRRGARALVVDPAHVTGAALFRAVEVALAQRAALVAYCELDPMTVRRLLELNEQYPMEVVVPGVDDEDVVLARAIEPGRAPTATSMVRQQLAAVIRHLPSPLNSAVLAILCGQPIPHRAADLLAASVESRRTGERRLLDAGLGSPTRLLKCARLARAWDAARERVRDEAFLAEKAGYGSKEMLMSDVRDLVGSSFRRAREQLRTPEFASIVATAARRAPGASSE